MARKLYKDPSDKKIAGVCSGMAKYFDVDVTLVRVGFLVFVFAVGGGLLAYILFWILLDNEPAGSADG